MLIVINVVLLVAGMFMEPVPMMVLLGPTLMPVAVHYGIEPVHFGVMFVLNICIGIVHPPIGTNMFITCALARCSISHYTREAVPFLIALLLLLAVVTYIPAVTLTLPRFLADPNPMRTHSNAVTLHDIARAAGVSVNTVSRADGQARYQRRNQGARATACRSSRLPAKPDGTLARTGAAPGIGLVVTDCTHPFYATLIRAVEDAASSAGYSLLRCQPRATAWTRSKRASPVDRAASDGLLVSPVQVATPQMRDLLNGDAESAADARRPTGYKGPFIRRRAISGRAPGDAASEGTGTPPYRACHDDARWQQRYRAASRLSHRTCGCGVCRLGAADDRGRPNDRCRSAAGQGAADCGVRLQRSAGDWRHAGAVVAASECRKTYR